MHFATVCLFPDVIMSLPAVLRQGGTKGRWYRPGAVAAPGRLTWKGGTMVSHLSSRGKSFWISLGVIFLTQSFFALYILYPTVLKDQGFSLGFTGFLMSVFNICSTLGRPFGARFTERIGTRKSLAWTSGIVAGISVLPAFTENPLLLLAIRGMSGAFWGISMVAITSYQGLAIPEEERGGAYSWISVAYILPQVTVFPLADWFVSAGRLPAFFLLGAVVEAAIVGAVIPLPPVREPEARKNEPAWGAWRELPGVPGFMPVLCTMVLFTFVNASTLQYLPVCLSERGYPASVFIVPNALAAVIFRLVAFRVMDRIRRREAIGPVIASLGLVLAFLPFLPGRGWYAGAGLAYGVVLGMCFPILLALMPDVFPEHLRPKGISLCLFAMDLGFILSPFFQGYGGEIFSLSVMLSVTGILGAAGGVLLHASWRRVLARDLAGSGLDKGDGRT